MTEETPTTPPRKTMRFSASSAARLMACPGSADLESAIPGFVHPVRDDTAGAKGHGTNMHAIFEKLMELSVTDLRAWLKVLEYMEALRSTRRFKILTEQTVPATWLQTQPKTTVDLVLYTQDEIHVIDLKWGRIPVEVHDNDQLMYYSACFLHLAPLAKGVHQHIVQPHADNMESVFVTATELGQWMAKAQAAEAAILAGDLTLHPSDHCTFCPANPHSRGDKGNTFCGPMLQLLYPPLVDEDEILSL